MNCDNSLAEVIIAEHDQLGDADKQMVQALLQDKTGHKVLLLIDGYDEYKKGTNRDIDRVIETGLPNGLLILTSRPGTDSGDGTYVSQQIKNKMAAEFIIDGFDGKSLQKYCEQYFNSEKEAERLLKQAEETNETGGIPGTSECSHHSPHGLPSL